MDVSVFSPISATSAPEAVVRRITEAIATGSLRAGEKLPREDELAKTLGVAPMTLRQALASMRELNLVETTRGRNGGTYVRHDVLERLQEAVSAYPATAEQIRSLTDWRRAISARLAFWPQSAGLKTSSGRSRPPPIASTRCTWKSRPVASPMRACIRSSPKLPTPSICCARNLRSKNDSRL